MIWLAWSWWLWGACAPAGGPAEAPVEQAARAPASEPGAAGAALEAARAARRGDVDEAVRTAEALVATADWMPEAHFLAAVAWLRRKAEGDEARARHALSVAVSLPPVPALTPEDDALPRVEARVSRAILAIETGESGYGVDLATAVRDDPSTPTQQRALMRVMQLRGAQAMAPHLRLRPEIGAILEAGDVAATAAAASADDLSALEAVRLHARVAAARLAAGEAATAVPHAEAGWQAARPLHGEDRVPAGILRAAARAAAGDAAGARAALEEVVDLVVAVANHDKLVTALTLAQRLSAPELAAPLDADDGALRHRLEQVLPLRHLPPGSVSRVPPATSVDAP